VLKRRIEGKAEGDNAWIEKSAEVGSNTCTWCISLSLGLASYVNMFNGEGWCQGKGYQM
jgi:hypothetical protein